MLVCHVGCFPFRVGPWPTFITSLAAVYGCSCSLHPCIAFGRRKGGFRVRWGGDVVRSDDPTIFCLMLGGGGWNLYMKLLEMT